MHHLNPLNKDLSIAELCKKGSLNKVKLENKENMFDYILEEWSANIARALDLKVKISLIIASLRPEIRAMPSEIFSTRPTLLSSISALNPEI